MVVLGSQILIHLVSAVPLGRKWDVVALIALDNCVRKSTWLLLACSGLKIVLRLVMLHLRLALIWIYLSHVALIICILLVAASLLLRWTHPWNRLYLSPSSVAIVRHSVVVATLAINWGHWWSSARLHQPIILWITSSLSSSIALRAVGPVLLIRLILA